MLRVLRDILAGLTCPHPLEAARCVHGDEINARHGARRACTRCGRSLPGDLPIFCTTTGLVHTAYSTQAPPS